jgi:exonuclease III
VLSGWRRATNQEHKLQEKDVAGMEKQMLELLPNYKAHWVCSTEKLGYAGVVVFTKGEAAS